MDRYRSLRPAELSDAQRRVYDSIVSGPRGLVEGPLEVWLHSPRLAERAQALGAYCRYHSYLPPRLSELAIVTVGAYWQAGFEWTVHAPLAAKAGIGDAVLEAIRTGAEPAFTQVDEAAVFRFTKELLRDHRVSPQTFADAERLLGTEGVVDLTGILGYYTLISMTILAFEVPLPEGAPEPFVNAG